MELTREYFEETLDKKIKEAVALLPTKTDLKNEIKASEECILKRVDEAQEELARLIADTVAVPFTERLNHLEKLLTVKQEVETLRVQMAEVRSALHLHGA